MESSEDVVSLVNRLMITSPISRSRDQVAILPKGVPDNTYGKIVTVIMEKDPKPSLEEDTINSLQGHEKKRDPKKESSGA